MTKFSKQHMYIFAVIKILYVRIKTSNELRFRKPSEIAKCSICAKFIRLKKEIGSLRS